MKIKDLIIDQHNGEAYFSEKYGIVGKCKAQKIKNLTGNFWEWILGEPKIEQPNFNNKGDMPF